MQPRIAVSKPGKPRQNCELVTVTSRRLNRSDGGFYADVDYLMWWTEGARVPPLVTSGPSATQPGYLPATGASYNVPLFTSQTLYLKASSTSAHLNITVTGYEF